MVCAFASRREDVLRYLHAPKVRPHPDAGDAAEVEMGHLLGQHKHAPGDIARIAGQFFPKELPAHVGWIPVRNTERSFSTLVRL